MSRYVAFLRDARAPCIALPLAADQARVLALHGREVFTAYLPTDKGPVFMKLMATAFGSDVTTRSWDTVARCAEA